jgi:hypothetical protein
MRSCHRLGLGEHLGVGADADLQILAPQTFGLQECLDLGGLGRSGDQIAQAVTDHPGDAGADFGGKRGVSSGAFLDHPFDHGPRESDAAGLDRLQIAGGQQAGGFFGRLNRGCGEGCQRAKVFTGKAGDKSCDIRQFQQITHGGRGFAGDVKDMACADGDKAGADACAPDAAQPQALGKRKLGHSCSHFLKGSA